MNPSEKPPVIESSRTSTAKKRLLLISYHFPPVGGAGVQRPLKFVKYLRQFGWDVSVLMAANPSVPVFDESLCRDLPQDLVIEKARTWEPDYKLKQQIGKAENTHKTWLNRTTHYLKGLARSSVRICLQPDAQILWVPNALRSAKQLLKRLPHDAILATAPPYSNLLLGAKLKRLSGLPLIVDYRDEWDLSSKYLENSHRDWFSRLVQERMQRQVLRQADAIIATTDGSTARLQDRAIKAGSRAHAFCIFNGFDPSDFEGLNTSETNPVRTRYQIVYTGTLWNLTTVQPMVEAIERLNRESPEILDRLELVFVGRKTQEQLDLLRRLTLTRAKVVIRDYCDHAEALQLMANADCLCLLLSAVPGAERVAPAKLFEYLALRKPILAITPEGETASILKRYFPRNHFTPDDVPGIANWLTDHLAVYPTVSTHEWSRTPAADVSMFTREHQTAQLAGILDELVGSTTVSRPKVGKSPREALEDATRLNKSSSLGGTQPAPDFPGSPDDGRPITTR